MAEPKSKGESGGTGSRRSRPAATTPEPEAEAPKPTPESIGIEGVVHVGGHRLDDDQGWVTEPETPDEGEKGDD